jgi:antibiotic biosynthesis monooxygenase (ABM) superfamily enzyme
MLHEKDSPDYTLLYSFSDRSALQAWLDSPDQRQLLRQADELAEQHLRLPPPTGLEAWFTLPHRATIKPPPRWKM